MAAGSSSESRAQLANLRSPARSRRERSPQEHYVAEVVSPDALRHRVHANGGGDRAVSLIAARQLGVIATWQLRAAGWNRGMISRRARSGRLHRLHRGVYLVGNPTPLPGARELAGLLACGEGALVSHRSAALLWGLTSAPPREVEVSVPARNCQSRRGLRVRRLGHIDARDRTLIDGIPVTSPARTLVDFAATAKPEELEWAVAEARARLLVSDRELSDALDRAGNRAGVGALRAALRNQGGPRLTRSGAERLLLRLIRAAKLPEPEANARIAGFEVDFVWPQARLVVEVDGVAFHGHRGAFERDRRRDMALRDAGYEVIRVTWRQLVDEPLRVIAHITRALTRAGWSYSSSASRP